MQRTCPNGHRFEAPSGLAAVCPECRVPLAGGGARVARVAIVGVVALALISGGATGAWWLLRDHAPASDSRDGAASPPAAHPEQVAAATLERLLALADFAGARALLEGLPAEVLAAPALRGAAARVEAAEAAHRARIRVFEVVIEEIATSDERASEEVHARVLVGEAVVHVTPPLSRRFHSDEPENAVRRAANVFALRSSYELGFALEITDAKGRALVPVAATTYRPLADLHEGQLASSPAGGDLRRLLLSYAESPFAVDEAAARLEQPAASGQHAATDEDVAELLQAAREALASEAVDEAQRATDAAAALRPEHAELPPLRQAIDQTRHAILENDATYECVIAELSFDPRPDGKPWYDIGDKQDLWVQALVGDKPASAETGPVVPRLLPDRMWANPGNNRFFVTCKGTDEVRLQVTDQLLVNEPVGSFLLPRRFADLPRPEGQVVVERSPEVAVLPAEDPNRCRRLVLYYRVVKPQ